MATNTVVRQLVEFYTIELAQLADRSIHVSLTATTVDESEPQLLSQEIARDRVASIDDALSLIRKGLLGTIPS